jgi:hypothetical protein
LQPPFSCTPLTYSQLERSFSPARLGRYLAAANGDKHYALRLYVWNVRLCEAFYLPTQFAEVTIRNAIHGALATKHGLNWESRGSFLCTLPDRLRRELDDVIRTERAAYGAAMTVDHIVSGLSFGFWLHLLTKKYEGVLWPTYFPQFFPNMPANITRTNLYDRLDSLRIFRNRLAHHKPIFDRSPKTEYNNLLDTVRWACSDMHWFITTLTRIDQTLSARPRY